MRLNVLKAILCPQRENKKSSSFMGYTLLEKQARYTEYLCHGNHYNINISKIYRVMLQINVLFLT